MNKVLIIILILGAGALALYIIGGNRDALPPGIDIPEDVNVEDV